MSTFERINTESLAFKAKKTKAHADGYNIAADRIEQLELERGITANRIARFEIENNLLTDRIAVVEKENNIAAEKINQLENVITSKTKRILDLEALLFKNISDFNALKQKMDVIDQAAITNSIKVNSIRDNNRFYILNTIFISYMMKFIRSRPPRDLKSGNVATCQSI